MVSPQLINWIITLVGLSIGNLIALLTFGYRLMKFVNRIEFRVDLMWKDYESRIQQYEHWRSKGEIERRSDS